MSSCIYHVAETSRDYDFTSVAAGSPFNYSDSAVGSYVFSFCQTVPVLCSLPSSNAMLTGNYCMHSFGVFNSSSTQSCASVDVDCISLVYSGGSWCGKSAAYTVFNVMCDSTLEPNQFIVDSVTTDYSCKVVYNGRSNAGCGTGVDKIVRTIGVGWIVFLVLLGVVLLYLIVGSVYKKMKYGANGIEMIPNIDTWRAIYYRITGVCCRNRRETVQGAVDEGGDYGLLDTF